MTIYATLTLINTPHPNQVLNITEDDIVEAVDGGFEVSFASSPGTVTFYPFHRVWEYQEINTAKLSSVPEKEEPSSTHIGRE